MGEIILGVRITPSIMENGICKDLDPYDVLNDLQLFSNSTGKM